MDIMNLGDVSKLGRKSDLTLLGPNLLAGLSTASAASTVAADALASMKRSGVVTDTFEIMKRSGVIADNWADYNPTAGLAQQYAPVSYLQGIDVKSHWPLFSLDYPLGQYMSTVNLAEVMASSWKPILMQQARLPEVDFVSRLQDVERSLYSALRPELWSVAQHLHTQYEWTNVGVRWLGTADMDFDLDVDVEDGPTTETSLAIPAKPQRILSPRTLMDDIDTTTGQRRLRTRLQRIVWIAGRPYAVLRVLSAGTSVLIGWNIGEAVGNAGLG